MSDKSPIFNLIRTSKTDSIVVQSPI